MIKALRKRHRQIWILTALILPALIIAGWLAIPNMQPVKFLQEESTVLLPVIVKSKDENNYLVNIRSNNNKSLWQLEWKNKSVLMVPSAVIYKIINPDENINKQQLIGRIETQGSYLFSLANDSTGYKKLNLVLYDFIHEKIIDSINF